MASSTNTYQQTTATSNKHTSASQVFAIPELLENILLQLPLRDLLLAQRIDRTYREAVQTSPKIQQALFFRPHKIDLVRLADFSEWPLPCTSRDDCTPDVQGESSQRPESSMKCDSTGAQVDYVIRNPLLPFWSESTSMCLTNDKHKMLEQ